MFRKFWSRSAKYGQNRGFGRLQRSRGFLSSILGPTLSTSNNGLSPNLAATFRKGFSIIYCLRVISTLYVVCLHYLILRIDVVICHSPPKKKLKIERGQTRTLLRPAYSPGDAQHRDDHSMVVQGQGVSHLGQLFVPRTVSELHGVNFTNRIFAYFLYKMDETYLPMTGLYSPGYSGRSKGAPFTSAVFLWRLMGELRTAKVTHIFIYGKYLCSYTKLYHMARQICSSEGSKCVIPRICSLASERWSKFWE